MMRYDMSLRVEKGLRQCARRKAGVNEDELVHTVVRLVSCCGEASHGRPNVVRLGERVACGPLRVLVPVCPDYTHEAGVYTFRGLGNGVSLVAERHLVFMTQLADVLPDMQVVFVLADTESEDTMLCRAVGLHQSDFEERVLGTLTAMEARVSAYGWHVRLLSEYVPDLAVREQRALTYLTDSLQYRSRIERDAIARASMYEVINPDCTPATMSERTLRTASQYVALGEFVREREMVVCNHTTVNLAWYRHTDTPLLHNDVVVY